jgi:hypothetical protein
MNTLDKGRVLADLIRVQRHARAQLTHRAELSEVMVMKYEGDIESAKRMECVIRRQR